MKQQLVLRNPWWVVLASTVGLMFSEGPIVLFTFGVFLKPVAGEFHWNRGTVASAIVISQVLGGIVTPWTGKLVDRWGIRRVTLPFIAIFALSIAAIALTPPSRLVFIFLYAVCGVAAAGQGPLPYVKAISAWFDGRRGLALGIAVSGVGLGAALMPQLAGLLIRTLGWRSAYVGLGVATFVVAFPMVALFVRTPEGPLVDGREIPGTLRVTHGSTAELHGMTAREARGSLRFWAILIAVFFVSAAGNGAIAHIVPLLTDRGISTQLATSVLSVSGLALIVGKVIAGYLLDRLPAPYVSACLFLLPIVGIILLANGSAGPSPLLGAAFLGLGIGAEINIMAFLVGRYFGLRAFGEIYGYLMALFLIGGGMGPWLMGICFDVTHSYHLALVSFSVALFVASILISRLGPYVYPAHRVIARLETPSPAAQTP